MQSDSNQSDVIFDVEREKKKGDCKIHAKVQNQIIFGFFNNFSFFFFTL